MSEDFTPVPGDPDYKSSNRLFCDQCRKPMTSENSRINRVNPLLHLCDSCINSTPEYTGQPLGLAPIAVVMDAAVVTDDEAEVLVRKNIADPFVIPDDQIPLVRKSYESLLHAAETSLSMVADADVYHPIWEVCASESITQRMVNIALSERELRMLIFAMLNILDGLEG